MTTLDESLILALMCGITVCDYIRWKPDIDINESLILTLMCGIKVCDYIRWKPDIDINVWYKGLWLHYMKAWYWH